MRCPAPLLLLTEAKAHRYKPVYSAVEVFSPFSENEQGWQGWVLGNARPRPVRVVPPLVDVVQGTTGNGWIWFEDGREVPRLTDEEWAKSVVGARQRVSLSPPESLALPVFVSGDPDLRPCQRRLVIRLLARTLSDFADARVDLDLFAHLFSPSNEALIGHRAAAETLAPGPGLTIPVEIDTGGWRTGGVLRIDERLDESVFSSMLWLSDSTSPLVPGTILSRRARRDTLDKAFLNRADVGKVINAGPVEPVAAAIPPDPRDDDVPPEVPIVCLSCGQRLRPRELLLEELEIADHWAYRVAFERELRSYRAGTPRNTFLCDRIGEYKALLAGRRVLCPYCVGGTVSFEPGWWEKLY